MSEKKYVEDYWVNSLWVNLNRTIQILRLEFTREAKKMNIDILPEQWIILYNLFQNDGLTQVEIAALNYKHTPSISRTINRLVEKQLVIRKAPNSDRRKFKIYLTPKGKQLVEKLYPRILEVRKKSWGELTKEDFNHFVEILQKMQDNLS